MPLQAPGTQNGTQRTKNPIPDVEMGFLVVMDGIEHTPKNRILRVFRHFLG
jgi:hypothetical protein